MSEAPALDPLAYGPGPEGQLGFSRLELQVHKVLSASGAPSLGSQAVTVRFLADFLQALSATPAAIVAQIANHADLVADRLERRTEIPRTALLQVAGLLFTPEFSGRLTPEEMAAYEARFGVSTAAALLEGEQDGLDMAAFGRRHGSADSLLLLDTMMALAAVHGPIEAGVVADLRGACDALGVDDRYFGSLLWRYDPRYKGGEIAFPLKGDNIRIGRSATNEVVLVDPQVAPLHARLVRQPDGWRILEAGSGRPLVVDGETKGAAPVTPGQTIGIGPYTLWLDSDGQTLRGRTSKTFAALSVRHLSRHIEHRHSKISLLSDVSFTAYSGEVVALVGPSGCGKTTLISAISGISPANSGEIRYNGENFHTLLAQDRSIVGIVPQDDLVYAQLTVEESLYLAGKLRFAAGTPDLDVRAAVDRVIQKLDLERIRTNPIGDVQKRGISGGQRKRVNLGQELLTQSTRILFLDEPTSGLDPRTAQDIARTVRRLADEGRIVFIVTHDLTPAVIAQVDHLLVMAPGGHLAFFGPPSDACRFFGITSPDELFARLDLRRPAEWGETYRRDLAFQKYVTTREYLAESASIRPVDAPEISAPGASPTSRSGIPNPAPRRRSLLRDLATQTVRYLKVHLRDHEGTLVLVGQPLLLFFVMLLAFPHRNVPFMFMLTLASLWFGMSASVRELIVDRPIWRRERRVGAKLVPYLGSKVLVLGAIVVLQCTFMVAMLFGPFRLNEAAHTFNESVRIFIHLAGVQALTGFLGVTLGLVVSAFFPSSEAAVGTLPLLLVPQIAFSTILVPIRRMQAAGTFLSNFDPLRYALDAAIKTQEKLFFVSLETESKWDRKSLSGCLWEFGLKSTSDVDDVGLPTPTLLIRMGIFCVVFLVATVAITRWRDRQTG